jgi:hypothetical protein
MMHGNVNHRRVFIALSALAWLSACSGSSSSSSSTTNVAATVASTVAPKGSGATDATSPADSVALDAASSDATGPGDFLLPDPLVGLSELSSYRAALTVTFEGTDGGKGLHWSSTTVMQRSAQTTAAVTIENSGDIPAADPGYIGELNGMEFRRDATGGCTAEAGDRDTSMLDVFEPAAELAGVLGAETAGSKAIGNIDAQGYSFDERAVGQAGLGHTTGEVWVAADTGVVLTYAMTSKGGAELFGDGVDGTISWAYELTDVDAPVSVEVPDACRAGLLGAPTPEGATDVVNTADVLTYQTGLSTADVLSFYDKASTDLGWTSTGSSANDTSGTAEFSAGDKVVTIIVTASDAGSSVNLMLGDKPSSGGAGGGGGGAGGPAQGQATFDMRGSHTATGTWEFAPAFSAFGGGSWRISFTDPANPLPAGSFLTLVLTPGDENLSFSDGGATIIAGPDVCTFSVDHQDAGGASGTVECAGAKGMGTGGSIDISITFSATK